MKPMLLLAILASLPAAAHAGPIGNACLKSDRSAATRPLCNCIDNAARSTLNRGDQRMAAKFFKDPHRAQEIRQSDRRSHEVFWKRYKTFLSEAQRRCS